MLVDEVWLPVGIPVHPKGWMDVKFLLKLKTISLWSCFCALGHCHVETGKGQTQTVATTEYSADLALHSCNTVGLKRIKIDAAKTTEISFFIPHIFLPC